MTSFKRLLETPEVRAKLGIGVENKELRILGDEGKVAKALQYVVNDFASGNKKVADIYTRPLRLKYADELPANIVVLLTKAGERITAKKAPAKRKARVRARPREILIPDDCILHVTDVRCRRLPGRSSESTGLPVAASKMWMGWKQ